MQNNVGTLAFILSIITFFLFLTQSICDLILKFKQQEKSLSPVGGAAMQSDISDTLNAFAKLVDSLNKSSPALLSLLASILFLALALFSTSSMFRS